MKSRRPTDEIFARANHLDLRSLQIFCEAVPAAGIMTASLGAEIPIASLSALLQQSGSTFRARLCEASGMPWKLATFVTFCSQAREGKHRGSDA